MNCCHISNESLCLSKMIKFFDNNYFICFEDEIKPSISANITALIALKSFTSNPVIDDIIAKVVDWLKTRVNENGYIFSDKWHVSPLYTISRAVFAFQGIDDQLMNRCVNQLLSHRNSDNGWGISGSTLEETSLVTLALCHWLRTNPQQKTEPIVEILKSIKIFINEFRGNPYVELWIAKCLYCPKLVIDMFVLSAQYSLDMLS